MKQLIKSIFSCKYNEIVQCPNTSDATSILVIGYNIPMGL